MLSTVFLVLLSGAPAIRVAPADALLPVVTTHDTHESEDEKKHKWVVVEGERVVHTVKAGEGWTLDLHNLAGDVMVSGTQGNEARVEALPRAKAHSDADARQALASARVDIQEHANRLSVASRHAKHQKSRVWVDYTVSAPAGMAAVIKTMSGNIRVMNVAGTVRIEAISGDVQASGLRQLESLKTVSGDIVLSGSRGAGGVMVATVSGDIEVRDFKARELNVETVSGDVTVSKLAAEQVSANSFSGDVLFDGVLSRGGHYKLMAHSGDIVFKPIGTTGFELAASCFNGTIKSDLQIVSRAGVSQEGRPRSVRGTVGDGGATVELTTFSGDIHVTGN
jgi:hypothetical protein